MSSDTPRTDAAILFATAVGVYTKDEGMEELPHDIVVQADLARELERENNALRARVGELEQQLHALRLVCGTTDANKFQTVIDRQLAKIAELERALVLAEHCAQWHIGDGDECGEVARQAISAIEAVRSKERT